MHKILKSVWFFPFMLAAILLLLVCLEISGSSIGIYHSTLYGTAKDNNLLVNKPQSIRSDEWLVTTQLTIGQKVAGFPRVNPNIDNGRDVSVVGDAPYKDWSTIFKPQNLAFFILPFGMAFAFKWWLLLYLVIISCYFFVLRLFPGKRLLATFLSIAVGCSPFLFWWYSTGTLAPIFYGFFIILVGLRILGTEPIPLFRKKNPAYSQITYSLVLAYLLTSFAMVFYPPFQIPVAISVMAFLAGVILKKHRVSDIRSRDFLLKTAIFAIGALLAVALLALFIHTRSSVINSITNTVYPGKRESQGGGGRLYEILSTFLQPQLQRPDRAAHFYDNQSAASNFILFLPFLLVPGFALIAMEKRRLKRMNWPLLTVQLCATLFLANYFTQYLQPIYKLFLLDKVPYARLLIGLGFVGFLQLLLIMKSLSELQVSRQKLNVAAGLYTLLCASTLVVDGFYIRSHYPDFIRMALIGVYALAFCLILFCFLSQRLLLGALLFCLFSFSSVYRIHPLYRGLGPLYDSRVTQAIDRVSQPGSRWISMDTLLFENYPLLAGRDSLSGVQPYPNLAFWSQLGDKKEEYIYNRYAHVLFVESPPWHENLQLVQDDFFEVRFSCNTFTEKNIDFVLNTSALNEPCLVLKDKVKYPAATFLIYQVRH